MDNNLDDREDYINMLSKEVLDQLIMKDQIINDLKHKLEEEQLENRVLRKKVQELDNQLLTIEDKIEEEAFKLMEKENKDIYKTKERNDKDLNELHNTMMGERLTYMKQVETLEKELLLIKEKNQSYAEIERIYKHQLENHQNNTKIIENLTRTLNEKELYIEELLNKEEDLVKNYERIIRIKDDELKESKAQLHILSQSNERLSDQLTKINQNNNNYNHDVIKHIRSLEEQNRSLENKNKELENLQKTKEIYYKQELEKLEKILIDSGLYTRENFYSNNSSNNIISKYDQSNNNNSSILRIDDLTHSLSKSLKDKIETQSKKITEQNINLMTLQYENERLTSELKSEKEFTEKLQKNIADMKYKSNIIQLEKEEATTQTNLRMDDIDSFRTKIKILENNLNELSTKFETIQVENKELLNKIKENQKEKIRMDGEIKILMRKIENSNKNIDLNLINETSKLNSTISILKLRENELLEKIQILENSNNFQPTNSKDFHNNNDYQNNLRESYIKNDNNINCNNDLLTHKLNIEIKKLEEDNFLLKNQQFSMISDLNKYKDHLKTKELYNENMKNENDFLKQEIEKMKNFYINENNNLLKELKESKTINSDKIEEMKQNLQNIIQNNTKLNEQFESLQKKFIVQSKLIQDKNEEIHYLNSEKDKLILQNDQVKLENEELLQKLKLKDKTLQKIKNDSNQKTVDNQNFYEIDKKNELQIKQIEERNKIVNEENNNLKQTIKTLKDELNKVYKEFNKKDKETVYNLKMENKEYTNQLIEELKHFKEENMNLQKERAKLMTQLNKVQFESAELKDKLTKTMQSKAHLHNKSFDDSNYNLNFSKKRFLLNDNKDNNERNDLTDHLQKQYNEINHLYQQISDYKVEIQAFLIEKDRLIEIISNKDQEINKLKNDLIELKTYYDDNMFNKYEKQIQDQNESIQILTKENQKNKEESLRIIKNLENVNLNQSEQIKELNKEINEIHQKYKSFKEKHDGLVRDLKKENEILINDLNQKEEEIQSLMKDRMNLRMEYESKDKSIESQLGEVVNDMKIIEEENKDLKIKYEKYFLENKENYDIFNKKIEKNQKKIERLSDLYESHIKFLKERFEFYLNDFTHLINLKAKGEDPLRSKILKNLQDLSNIFDELAQVIYDKKERSNN